MRWFAMLLWGLLFFGLGAMAFGLPAAAGAGKAIPAGQARQARQREVFFATVAKYAPELCGAAALLAGALGFLGVLPGTGPEEEVVAKVVLKDAPGAPAAPGGERNERGGRGGPPDRAVGDMPGGARRRGPPAVDESGPPPDRRTYVHVPCGGKTVVSEGDFTSICNPYNMVQSTYCCTCTNFDALHRFHWDNTEELISDYRRRMLRDFPSAGPRRGPVWGAGVTLGFIGAGLLIGLPFGGIHIVRMFGVGAIAGIVAGLIVWAVNHADQRDYRRIP